MAYTALYRRLRPKTFKEVIGQEHIIKTLINEIETDTISHAYLFCGTRGTGKTSTAKIFAKAVNCTDLKDGNPCGECEMCVSADNASSMNIIELDAASHNGVDNIREIRDEVKYTPAVGKYKIYIIDEVHMLSPGAFNALLKTLEEPPSHIIFILATTDPQKIPVTILSRCQRFDFKRITQKDIVKALKEFSQSENIKISEDALFYIANLCEGAMRDALSILDRCIAYYYNEEITLSKVLDICGSVDNGVFFQLADALIDFNSSKCIEILNDTFEKGRDMVQFSNEFVTHLRNALVSLQVENNNSFSAETYEKYKEQALRASAPVLIKLITAFSELNATLKLNKNPKILLEVLCIRLCNALDNKTSEDIICKLAMLEKRFDEGIVQNYAPAVDTAEPKKKIELREKIVPKEMEEISNKWEAFAKSLEGSLISSSLSDCEAKTLEDELFYIVCKNEVICEKLKENTDYVIEKMAEYFGKAFKIKFILKDKFNSLESKLLSEPPKATLSELENMVNFDNINYTE